MNRKTKSTLFGVAASFFWFLPWIQISSYGDNTLYQNATHIGGITYLALLAAIAYAILSWIDQHVPRIISSGMAVLISLFYLLAAIMNYGPGIGLIGFATMMALGLLFAIIDYKKENPAKPNERIIKRLDQSERYLKSFERYSFIGLGIGVLLNLLNSFFGWNQATQQSFSNLSSALTIFFGIGIWALLILAISRGKRVWAKWTYLVIGGIGLVMLPFTYEKILREGTYSIISTVLGYAFFVATLRYLLLKDKGKQIS